MTMTTGTSGFFDTVHVAVLGDDPELENALEAALEQSSTRWRVSPLTFRSESIPVVERLSAQIVIVVATSQEAEARTLLGELSSALPGVVRILLASEMDREAPADLVLVEPYDVDELRDIIEVAHGIGRAKQAEADSGESGAA
jgi:DNA-binding response OmpR family regulator